MLCHDFRGQITQNETEKQSQSAIERYKNQQKKKNELSKVFTKQWKSEDFVKKPSEKNSEKTAEKKSAKENEKKKNNKEKNAKNEKKNKEQTEESDIKVGENKENQKQEDPLAHSSSDENHRGVVGASGIGAQKEDKADEESAKKQKKKSFDEWKQLLTNSPNRNTVSDFIKSYVMNELDQETFYQLAIVMMEHESFIIRRHGITALNAIVGFRSFKIMSYYYHLEPAESALHKQLRIHLDEYASLARLRHLHEILKLSEETALLEGSHVLRKMLYNLSLESEKIEVSDFQTQSQLLAVLIPILQNITHENQYVNQAIELTLADLNNFLNENA